MTLSSEIIKNIQTEMELIGTPPACDAPKVSVIVPAYNTEKYISKCILSLIKQTLKEIEIIVIDDGSNDNTVDIIKEYAKYDHRIKFLQQEHSMQGAARNLGVSVAKGEYIGYVDSDDWVDEDYYEKLYKTAARYRCDIALATNVRIGFGKTKKRLNIEKENFVIKLQEKIDVNNQFKNPCPTNKIYKKSMLLNNKIEWPEGVFCEDKLYTIKAVYCANGIATVPGTNYYYFRNPNSTVNTNSKVHIIKRNKDRDYAKLEVIKFLRDNAADIKDGKIWATRYCYKILGIPIYTHKESIHTVKYLLFGIIPVCTKKA